MKAIQLAGLAREYARSIMKVRDQHNAEMQALETEYAQRRAFLVAQLQQRIRLLFPMMLEALGLPRADMDKWSLDVKHLADHGVAFLEPLGPQPQEVPQTDIEQAKTAIKH